VNFMSHIGSTSKSIQLLNTLDGILHPASTMYYGPKTEGKLLFEIVFEIC
jgi:hypothetical protein